MHVNLGNDRDPLIEQPEGIYYGFMKLNGEEVELRGLEPLTS